MFDPQHDVRRVAPVPPDQAQRLRPDEHGEGRSRRARPWIAVAAALLLVAAFVLVVLAGGGDAEGTGSPDTDAVARVVLDRGDQGLRKVA